MSLRDRASLNDLEDLFDESESEIIESEKVVRIPKHIIYSTKQVRRRFNTETIQELGKSLEVQQEQPIIVCPMDSKGFRIQKGERRWRGAMSNDNITHLDCIIRKKGDVFGQLVENIQREDLHPIDLGLSFEEAKEEHGLNNRQLAEKLSKPEAYISKYINAAKAPEYVLQAYDDGLVGDVDTINELRKAAKEAPETVKSLLEKGEKVTRAEAIEVKNTNSAKKPKDNKPKQQGNANKVISPHQKLSRIRVKVADRLGLAFASGKETDKLNILFDDGSIESVSGNKVRIVGYQS